MATRWITNVTRRQSAALNFHRQVLSPSVSGRRPAAASSFDFAISLSERGYVLLGARSCWNARSDLRPWKEQENVPHRSAWIQVPSSWRFKPRRFSAPRDNFGANQFDDISDNVKTTSIFIERHLCSYHLTARKNGRSCDDSITRPKFLVRINVDTVDSWLI